MNASLPRGEPQRLAALERYDILDTPAEQAYDDLTLVAAQIAQAPIALISLVDRDRQWSKSKMGLTVSQTPRELAFCAHAILEPDKPLIVTDATRDPRFADNALVRGNPEIRFYFGAPLVTADRHALGTLCVIDRVPRKLTQHQIDALQALSRQVISQLELRRQASTLQAVMADRECFVGQLETTQATLEAMCARLRNESLTDALTGLANRRAFDIRLAEEIARAERYDLPLSLLLIDVDHFKAYNDTYGHPAGDRVLQAVSGELRLASRPGDFAARFGGEEFAIILTSTCETGACRVAERVRLAIESTAFANRRITASVGSATYRRGVYDALTLIRAADAALYRAKEAGRNRTSHGEASPGGFAPVRSARAVASARSARAPATSAQAQS